MPGTSKTGSNKQVIARPIKTKQDYERVLSVTQRLLAQPNRDTAAEQRLKALLEEMDRFEEVVDDPDDDLSDASQYGGPQRRWSDEGRDD